MSGSDNYWLGLVERIDLPGHDQVVSMLKKTYAWPKFIYPIFAAIIAYAVLRFAKLDGLLSACMAGLIAGIGIVLFHFGEKASGTVNRFREAFAGLLAVLGFFGAGLFLIHSGKDWMEVALWAFGCGIGGAIAGYLALSAIATALTVIQFFLVFISLPLSWPVLRVITFIRNRRLRKMGGWTTANKKQVIVFGNEVVAATNGWDSPIFVAHSSMRRNGRAQDEGIPKFTYAELKDTQVVSSRLADAAASTDLSHDSSALNWAAPLLGGAVIGGTTAVFLEDIVQSNLMQDINPASGLPTVAGIGSPDVAGNNWGTTDNQF